ncbi:hypothetical protein [Methylorubrum sp. GM97]|uniref:hypothetical protein n=1 Tax=Methylorubrum sp. GM97 TaxID=2938232 RepID=UPI00218791FC|nr:hypothetical protein [Methylorubrum sp. GM97]BDL39084.1 hypothetical protein MSPGM_16740 [Methylorubrum sp. GM97]
MTTRAHDIVQAFDVPMQGMALGLGSVLIARQQARNAARREANAIRAVAGRMAYDRVMAQHAIDEAERHARAEDDRRRSAIRLRALAAKRARG